MSNAAILAADAGLERRSTEGAATWEKALAVCGFLVLLQTFRVLLVGGSSGRSDGSALFQLVSGSIYLAGMAAIVVYGVPAWAPRVLLRCWPIIVLSVLPLVSTVWSDAPAATFRRAIALILSSSFAFFLIIRFDKRTLFSLLAIAFTIYVVMGVLSAGVPGLGITGNGAYSGAWRGLTGQKNTFGRTLALAVAILPAAALLGLVYRQKRVLAVAAIAFLLLVLSRSATALVSAVGSLGVGTALYVALGGKFGGGLRLRPEVGVTVLVVVAITGALAVTFGWTAILEALGRDPTLTGRTQLWRWVIDLHVGSPWLGSGYRAFWIDENTKYFFEFFDWNSDAEGNPSDTFAGPEHSHSGYVDTLVELGWVGVGALGLVIVHALATLRRALVHGDARIGFIFAVILSFLAIYAVTERSILQQSEDLWFFFIVFYLLATKESLRAGNSAGADLAGFSVLR